MGKSPWIKNFEFRAKDPGVNILGFSPQNLEFGAPQNGQMFFAVKKLITDRISNAAGFSIFRNIINKLHNA
jgi:hypothetical protein